VAGVIRVRAVSTLVAAVVLMLQLSAAAVTCATVMRRGRRFVTFIMLLMEE
jgi:hypothetical protein